MSKHDFTAAEFAARLARLRAALAQQKLDWIVLFHPVSILWLTGCEAKSYQSFQCLFVAIEDRPTLMYTRASDRAEHERETLAGAVRVWGGQEPADPLEGFAAIARELGLPRGRVGIEVPAYYLHPHHYLRVREVLGAALVAEPTNLVAGLKAVKSPAEIAHIRRAAAIADRAMTVFLASVAAGRSELELAGEVYRTLLAHGSDLPASTMNLVTGERVCYAHGAPSHRRLCAGDAGNVECGATWHRYTSTIGRQFSLGPPSARHAELHAIVREACDAFIAEVRAGVPAVRPHEAAKRVIAGAGLDHGRIHTSGYGLAPGFPPSWGEPLALFGGSTDVLAAGMVVTVEPPIFLPEENIGVRIIDNLLVTDTGCEILARTPRELLVID